MRQVLFRIPGLDWPVFGYGVMLFIAFVVCSWVAGRRAAREGIGREAVLDLALWIFVGGIFGGRLLSMIAEPVPGQTWRDFYKLWQGGLVLYGAVAGGLLGYLLAYVLVYRRRGLSTLAFADVISPSVGLGLFFGRLGCFLTGCCYGLPVEPGTFPWGVSFPGQSPPHRAVVALGYQTAYGFQVAETADRGRASVRVQWVEKDAPAWHAGLRPKDRIVAVRLARGVADKPVPVDNLWQLFQVLENLPPQESLEMTVARSEDGAEKQSTLEILPKPSVAVHPTQLYMSLDGLILFFLLSAYYPFRRRPGEVAGMLMMTYGLDRFLVEFLRLDNERYAGNLTLSQYVSVGLLVAGLALWVWRRWGAAAKVVSVRQKA
ncbi:MAG: hypothetical protein C4297_00195 [Gemmataceae bacterium]